MVSPDRFKEYTPPSVGGVTSPLSGLGSGFRLALFVQLCNGGQDFANGVKFFVGAIANDLQKCGSVFGIGHGWASPFVYARVCVSKCIFFVDGLNSLCTAF